MKKDKKEKKQSREQELGAMDEDEYATAHFGRSTPYPSYEEYLKEFKERGWKENWEQIGKSYEKQREARKKQRNE